MTRHKWLVTLVSLWLVFLVWSLLDREPPTRVLPLPQGQFPPSGHPGEEITFVFPVVRELDRECSVRIQRSVVDSAGGARPYGFEQRINRAGLQRRFELMGNRLILKITIPATAPSGRSHLLTESSFSCVRNPSTYIAPIELSYDWVFDVLPPEPKTAIVIVEK